MKLVAVKQQPWELYDLATDRCETNDLAAARPQQVAALEAEWNRMTDECRALSASEASAKPQAAATIEGRSLVPLLCDATAAWPDRPLVGGRAAGVPPPVRRSPAATHAPEAGAMRPPGTADSPVFLQPDAEEPAADDKPARPRVKEPAA